MGEGSRVVTVLFYASTVATDPYAAYTFGYAGATEVTGMVEVLDHDFIAGPSLLVYGATIFARHRVDWEVKIFSYYNMTHV